MEMPAIMDLLAQKTEQLTQFIADKQHGDAYDECKTFIQTLQTEIEKRRQTSISNPDIKFEEPDSTL